MRKEVLGRGVLVESAHEVGDRRGEVPAFDEGRVEEQIAGDASDRGSLGRSHALEHLDLDASGSAGSLQLPTQADAPGNVEEIVARETDPNALVEGRVQEDVEDRLVVGVDFVLGAVGRGLPAVHLGLDLLHRKVGALDQAHLEAAAATGSSPVGPLAE